jgi:hypothetical protein
MLTFLQIHDLFVLVLYQCTVKGEMGVVKLEVNNFKGSPVVEVVAVHTRDNVPSGTTNPLTCFGKD